MSTTDQRTYEIGDRVTWPRQEGMSTGIVVQFAEIPGPLRHLVDDQLDVAVLPDGERTATAIPHSRIDYAPPIPVGSWVIWPCGGSTCRGQVVDPTTVRWSPQQEKLLKDGAGVAVVGQDSRRPIVQSLRRMRIVSNVEDVARLQPDALLAAIRTVQRAMQVVEGEGAGVTAHGAWDPSDFREGIETQGDFEATVERINDDLRAMARMARIAGAQR